MNWAGARLNESYFSWLELEALQIQDRDPYRGLMRMLHEIPFYWTIWSDENRAGDALDIRASEYLAFVDLNLKSQIDPVWLGQWATAAPSVLEVLVGICRRWSFYFENPVHYYFAIILNNLGFQPLTGARLPEPVQDQVRQVLDDWMSHQFPPDGRGTPFPVTYTHDMVSMNEVDIWGQMNVYSAEHFQ